jgi:uncharacterized protein YuzE
MGYPACMARLSDVLPEFAKQVEDSLRKGGDAELADQIPLTGFLRWTYDKSVDAGFIYLEPSRPLNIGEASAIRPFYSRSAELVDLPGSVLVDIDNLGRITGIELLNRADVFKELAKRLPQQV